MFLFPVTTDLISHFIDRHYDVTPTAIVYNTAYTAKQRTPFDMGDNNRYRASDEVLLLRTDPAFRSGCALCSGIS